MRPYILLLAAASCLIAADKPKVEELQTRIAFLEKQNLGLTAWEAWQKREAAAQQFNSVNDAWNAALKKLCDLDKIPVGECLFDVQTKTVKRNVKPPEKK